MNVSITRAKICLTVIGDKEVLANNENWTAFVQNTGVDEFLFNPVTKCPKPEIEEDGNLVAKCFVPCGMKMDGRVSKILGKKLELKELEDFQVIVSIGKHENGTRSFKVRSNLLYGNKRAQMSNGAGVLKYLVHHVH